MKIKLIDKGAGKLPERAHYNDSGADVFAVKDVVLEPHKVQAVGTGLGLIIPDGYDAVIHCKSGLSQRGVWAANAPIDASFRGEFSAILMNTTEKEITIKAGEKIGQIVIRPVVYADFVYDLGPERDDGCFGSTGR